MPSANVSVKELIERIKKLQADRGNWEAWWQDLAKYCIPHKAEITEKKSSGTKFDTDIYDSTARDSVEIFSAGLMGHLTSPSAPWLNVRHPDERVMKEKGVSEFFAMAGRKIMNVFHTSNFYPQLHEFYQDIPVFGTAGFYSEEDPEDVIRYYARNIKELLFELDDRGRVYRVYRIFEITALQAWLRWGNEAGKTVIEAATEKGKNPSQMFDFAQCVGPRDVRDPKKRDNRNMPFFSIWVNLKDQKKVGESGFEEFPFHIARYTSTTNEKHGYSPAMKVLPDIKMANKIMYIMIRASLKATDPPVMLPHSDYVLPLNFNPSGVNYRIQKSATSSDEQIQVFDSKGNIPAGRELLIDVREIIKRGFFTDLFLMLAERKNMTAFEVAERVQEKMLVLGPVIGRLQNDLLQPIIIRTFNILLRAGQLGELPPALLKNPSYEIEYVSVLAKAQRFHEIRSIETYIGLVMQIAQANPEALDKINVDEAIDRGADVLGIDPKLVNSGEVVKAIRQARREMQEMQAKLQMMQMGAETLKTGGEAAEKLTNVGGQGGRAAA